MLPTRKNHFYQSSRQTSTNNAKRKAMWTTTGVSFIIKHCPRYLAVILVTIIKMVKAGISKPELYDAIRNNFPAAIQNQFVYIII